MALRPHAPPPPPGSADRVQMTLRLTPEVRRVLLALATLRRTSTGDVVEQAVELLRSSLAAEERKELAVLLAAAGGREPGL